MNNHTHNSSRKHRPTKRNAQGTCALPINHGFDLRQFLRPEALIEEDTECWISHQQLPRQMRRLGLEFVLQDVLRRRWRKLLTQLETGLIILEQEEFREIRIAQEISFKIWPDLQAVEASLTNEYCERNFSFDVLQPLPCVSLIQRLLNAEPSPDLNLSEQLLNQTLPEPREDDLWQLLDLNYFPKLVHTYSAFCIARRMKRLFLSKAFNKLLRQALALDQTDILNALRARPESTQRQQLSYTFWHRCMNHREQLRAVAAKRPLIMPAFGRMLMRNEIRAEDSPEAVLKKLSSFPPELRIRFQHIPYKPKA